MDVANATFFGALAVLLIAGSYTAAQWILSRVYHEPLVGDDQAREKE